jgi:Fe-S-cluster containining protein
VAVTHHDLRRLSTASDRSCAEFVEWLPPDAVDMTGEPSSFVEFGAGRRVMVLAQRQQACALLDGENRCTRYEARPLDCQLYPFHLDRAATGTRLSLLELKDCGDARDGHSDPAALDELDRRRWRELAEYQAEVGRWNRMARHRRRLSRRVGDSRDFLKFLGLPV